ncbi:hypothetical protein MIR68_006328 [Amoeboaphelidium protococcarum]|nr:hypothetical protein MIR68_006328 [Amoeboaphelidium protococcarum]
MGRHAQIVIGPAGAGKSTYCLAMSNHIRQCKRPVLMVNLDPAAEDTYYEPHVDIRELITVTDVMDELQYGPNGGLVYAMNYLIEEFDWLEEEIGNDLQDEYVIIDFPGQLELFTYSNVVQTIIGLLQSRLQLHCCAVYLLESSFVTDAPKFFTGALAAMSCMIQLQIPHVNVLSKMDLIEGRPGELLTSTSSSNPWMSMISSDASNVEDNLLAQCGSDVDQENLDEQCDTLGEIPVDIDPEAPKSGYANTFDDEEAQLVESRRDQVQLDRFLETDTSLLLERLNQSQSSQFAQLSKRLVDLIDEFGLVNFIPLNIHNEESLHDLLYVVDQSLQHGEDADTKEMREMEELDEDDDNYGQYQDYY